MRRLGVLLHITSLYGRDLIGTLGKTSFDMLERLHKAHLSIWQVLPVCPIGYGASPYASPSLFAGNILLLDIDELFSKGFITDELCDSYFFQLEQYKQVSCTNPNTVDYEALIQYKVPFLYNCALHFLNKMKSNESLQYEYYAFCKEEEYWLDDYALFASLNGKNVTTKDIIKTLKTHKIECKNDEEIKEIEKILQFFFFKQWKEFKAKAQERDILLFGDVPMFPSYNSSDVAFHRELFCLDEEGEPTLVAGVPPDYFSSEGQLWGNPVYDWQKMQANNYEWWCNRIKHNLKFFDYLRLDHFRGFHSFWGVPYGEKTAKNGKWLEAGGYQFFDVLKKELQTEELPFIAEDLGIITDEVRALKDAFHLKGMNVLHFAFNASEYKSENVSSSYLPHNVLENSVIYTGTHDNNTTLGWLSQMQEDERRFVCEYVGVQCNAGDEQVARALMRLAIFSLSDWAIIPMQDYCLQDGSARMNTPSTTEGNWQWRMSEQMFDDAKIKEIANLAVLFSRYRK